MEFILKQKGRILRKLMQYPKTKLYKIGQILIGYTNR